MEANAVELREYMSELSESAYCAGWMKGLEFALWTAVLKGRLKYGQLQITQVHTNKLKELSERCGGWIVWDDESEETFVPLARWLKIYEVELSRGFAQEFF
jgi:hypothetical protein